MERTLQHLLAESVAAGRCSAAVVSVGDGGREISRVVVGHTRSVPDLGEAIGQDAVFDLASVTKPMATAATAMALVSRRRLDLGETASRWLPAIEPRITVQHLLGHAAGCSAHLRFFERLWQGDLAGESTPRAALLAMACREPLERAPGEAAVYSDLGYIMLAALLERCAGVAFEELFRREVGDPLGLAGARFIDLSRPRAADATVFVATERDDRRGLVVGEVHDENCHAGGGIAGHAGLFAPIEAVARFAAAMVELGAGNDQGTIRADVARHFFETSAAPATSWRLGWDTPSTVAGVSHAGDRWPRHNAIGHLGFTGTSLWLDLPHRRWVALLSNRVHPSRFGERAAAIKDLRRAVADTVVSALEKGTHGAPPEHPPSAP